MHIYVYMFEKERDLERMEENNSLFKKEKFFFYKY